MYLSLLRRSSFDIIFFVKNVLDVLEELNIKYEKYNHPAVFTVEEAQKQERGEGIDGKNLFLINKKGDKHYLVILPGSKRLNLKNLEKKIGESDLSFASIERLNKYLGVTPGSVSPFGLINDINREVIVIVDLELLNSKKQGFHPNINTQTLTISTKDFKKFLKEVGNKIMYINL